MINHNLGWCNRVIISAEWRRLCFHLCWFVCVCRLVCYFAKFSILASMFVLRFFYIFVCLSICLSVCPSVCVCVGVCLNNIFNLRWRFGRNNLLGPQTFVSFYILKYLLYLPFDIRNWKTIFKLSMKIFLMILMSLITNDVTSWRKISLLYSCLNEISPLSHVSDKCFDISLANFTHSCISVPCFQGQRSNI